jgi:phosphoglycerate kinase
LRTLDALDYAGKRVVVRVDFNVPLDGGAIADDTRILAALPTLRELRDGGAAKLVLLAHLGRPKGVDPALSLHPLAGRLGELLGLAVAVADTPEEAASHDAEVVMVENVRFFDGETKDDAELAARYAAAGDVYVNDAFGAAHRAHASTHGIAKLLPSAAGRLLQREVETLGGILENPARPLIAVVGGAKVTDKIGVLDRFAQLADHVVIGGAMIFPFLKAQGHAVGASLCEADGVGPAGELLAAAGDKLVMPVDLVLGDRFDASAERKELDGLDVPDGWMGLDIGRRSAARYAEVIRGGRTAFWNGPMGAFELEPFAAGTRTVAEAIVDVETSVVGGGDSVAAVNQFGLAERATHVSTGGGASLELIEGRALPGVEVLS